MKEISRTTVKRKSSRKLKAGKCSRLGEVIIILNENIEDDYAEEMRRARKGAQRKKASPSKRTPQG